MMRSAGDRHRGGHALLHVGKVARAGRPRGSVALARRGVAPVVEFADAWMTTIAVGHLAAVAAARGDAVEGLRLFSATEAARRSLAIAQAPYWVRDLERSAAHARGPLDRAAAVAAWYEGERMPLDEAVARALHVTEEDPRFGG